MEADIPQFIPKGTVYTPKLSLDLGDVDVKNHKKPIGFIESTKILNTVLEKEYPAITQGLKVDRANGLITALAVQKLLNNKFEKNVQKNWDEAQNKRNEKYYNTVALYNYRRANDMKMHNPERAQLLPEKALDALRSFDLVNFPIDNNGRLLSDPEDYEVSIGQKKYYAFNKKGELNSLRFPVLYDKLHKLDFFANFRDKRHIMQIPEVRILRSYILNGNNPKFHKDLKRILAYKNSLYNPELMAKRVVSKLGKIKLDTSNLTKQDFNKFISTKDIQSVNSLSEILKKENITDVAPYPQKLRNYFLKYLNEGKLNDTGKDKFAKFIEIYPKSIDKNYNLNKKKIKKIKKK